MFLNILTKNYYFLLDYWFVKHHQTCWVESNFIYYNIHNITEMVYINFGHSLMNSNFKGHDNSLLMKRQLHVRTIYHQCHWKHTKPVCARTILGLGCFYLFRIPLHEQMYHVRSQIWHVYFHKFSFKTTVLSRSPRGTTKEGVGCPWTGVDFKGLSLKL